MPNALISMVAAPDQLEAVLMARLATAFEPVPDMTVDQWADEHRNVTTETSSITGKWRTESYEIARGPMQAVTEEGVKQVTCVASAQLFKTSTIENAIGYTMHLDPKPILVYFPTDKTADFFIDSKLDPMVRNCPALADLFGGDEGLSKRNDNYTRNKLKFRGGILEILTAGSPADMGGRTGGLVIVDEVNKCELTKDGKVLALVKERLKGFVGYSTFLITSTPGIKGQCETTAQYEASDMRKPYQVCPHCDEAHYMKWEQVDKKTAEYICESCGVTWSEADRIRPLTTEGGILWRQTRPFTCCDTYQEPEATRLWDDAGRALCTCCGERGVSNASAGFWGWELHHPYHTVAELVEEYHKSKNDPGDLQNFFNSKLARTWDPDDDDDLLEVNPDLFSQRVEPAWNLIPHQVGAVTLGVDTQPMGKKGFGRLEVEAVGWGPGDESWSLGYHVLFGDPTEGEVWAQLDALYQQTYMTEDGRVLRAIGMCVDTGGDTEKGGEIIDAVTGYAARRKSMNVFAIKGASETSQRLPIFPPLTVMKSATKRNGAKIHLIGVQSAKDWVASCIAKPRPGPGYMHVPADRDTGWFEQMTNAKRVHRKVGGRRVSRWEDKSKVTRTEALDARVYAKAALEALRRIGPAKMAKIVPSAAGEALVNAKTEENEAVIASTPAIPAVTPIQSPQTPQEPAQEVKKVRKSPKIVPAGKNGARPGSRPGSRPGYRR